MRQGIGLFTVARGHRRFARGSASVISLTTVHLAVLGAVVDSSLAAEGCIVSQPPTVNASPCTYTATLDGEYVASGDWSLRIQRSDSVIARSSADGDPPVGAPGTILPGDVVTASVSSPGSSLAAGTARPFTLTGTSGCAAPAGGYDTGGDPHPAGPSDPLYPRQWGLSQIRAPAAWSRGALGQGVVVAVVDTGIDLGHPDLEGQLVPGIDLLEGGEGQPPDCPAGPQDEEYHGTEVAGVIAAETDNGIGVAGVAPEAKLMPVRVRASVESADFRHVAAGITFAANHGAKVISLTGGVAVPLKPSLLIQEQISEAAAYAWSQGVVLVATAGNTSLPWCQYPSSADHFICAAATDSSGRPATYSHLPVKTASGIALRAPGGARTGTCEDSADVWTTTLPDSMKDCGAAIRGYDTDSGTTFATAHTAGVAALLAGQGLTNEQIVACLRETSSNHGVYDPVMGYGIIDADAASAQCDT